MKGRGESEGDGKYSAEGKQFRGKVLESGMLGSETAKRIIRMVEKWEEGKDG